MGRMAPLSSFVLLLSADFMPSCGRILLKERVQSLHSYNREAEKEMARGGTECSVPYIHSSIMLSRTTCTICDLEPHAVEIARNSTELSSQQIQTSEKLGSNKGSVCNILGIRIQHLKTEGVACCWQDDSVACKALQICEAVMSFCYMLYCLARFCISAASNRMS
jgi:hypothetical protein